MCLFVDAKRHFQQYVRYIVAVSFNCGGKRRTRRNHQLVASIRQTLSHNIVHKLNIAHAIYVLNFLHVERWHIFEVLNHIYNVIFKYNVIYYVGRII
jgi:hypothetical protein